MWLIEQRAAQAMVRPLEFQYPQDYLAFGCLRVGR
jgi:hypothetical protein